MTRLTYFGDCPVLDLNYGHSWNLLPPCLGNKQHNWVRPLTKMIKHLPSESEASEFGERGLVVSETESES